MNISDSINVFGNGTYELSSDSHTIYSAFMNRDKCIARSANFRCDPLSIGQLEHDTDIGGPGVMFLILIRLLN
jgi:hypothetical protein